VRNCKLELLESLNTIGSNNNIPWFHNPVLEDAVVLACFSAGSYSTTAGEFCVSHNILWAAVLCSAGV
jgi:hypothetical protein